MPLHRHRPGDDSPLPPPRLSDSDRNIMWDLRFEPCDLTETCPSNYHRDECLAKED